MKKYLFIVAALFTITIFGCSHNNSGKQVDKMMNNFQQACQLTPDQVAKMRPMVEDFVKVRMENKKKFGDNMQAFRNANDSARKVFKTKLSIVLSPEQIQQFEQKMKQLRAQRKEQQTDNGE